MNADEMCDSCDNRKLNHFLKLLLCYKGEGNEVYMLLPSYLWLLPLVVNQSKRNLLLALK
ncbi:hypothetical protein BCL69_10743 [Nitrosomonas communis]|uniref:Uncharacterized protein n=1 Tax=Nitrosomonas communis TaxID=44574 RepID=A0A5D3YAB1_9PROT|nr:hypothetical protein BCL69_10743 [Nitrosomonas communis]